MLPPLFLWIVSQSHPLYHEHYLFPDAAGMALVMGALGGLRPARAPRTDGSAAGAGPVGGDATASRTMAPQSNTTRSGAGRVAVAAVVVPALVLGLAGLPQQEEYRGRIGHGEDAPAVAAMLTVRARPGDAVVYLPYWLRLLAVVYPLPAGVDEVTLGRGPEASATITGDVAGPEVVLQRLDGRCRVWAITQTWTFAGYGPTDDAVVRLLKDRYDQVHKESEQAFDVMLFRLRDPRCAARA